MTTPVFAIDNFSRGKTRTDADRLKLPYKTYKKLDAAYPLLGKLVYRYKICFKVKGAEKESCVRTSEYERNADSYKAHDKTRVIMEGYFTAGFRVFTINKLHKQLKTKVSAQGTTQTACVKTTGDKKSCKTLIAALDDSFRGACWNVGLYGTIFSLVGALAVWVGVQIFKDPPEPSYKKPKDKGPKDKGPKNPKGGGGIGVWVASAGTVLAGLAQRLKPAKKAEAVKPAQEPAQPAKPEIEEPVKKAKAPAVRKPGRKKGGKHNKKKRGWMVAGAPAFKPAAVRFLEGAQGYAMSSSVQSAVRTTLPTNISSARAVMGLRNSLFVMPMTRIAIPRMRSIRMAPRFQLRVR